MSTTVTPTALPEPRLTAGTGIPEHYNQVQGSPLRIIRTFPDCCLSTFSLREENANIARLGRVKRSTIGNSGRRFVLPEALVKAYKFLWSLLTGGTWEGVLRIRYVMSIDLCFFQKKTKNGVLAFSLPFSLTTIYNTCFDLILQSEHRGYSMRRS